MTKHEQESCSSCDHFLCILCGGCLNCKNCKCPAEEEKPKDKA